jgi:hypothetical protein
MSARILSSRRFFGEPMGDHSEESPAAEPVWESEAKNTAPIGVTAFEHIGKVDDMQVESRCLRKDGIKATANHTAFQILIRSSRPVR